MEDERVAEGHVVTDMLNSSGTDSIEDTARSWNALYVLT